MPGNSGHLVRNDEVSALYPSLPTRFPTSDNPNTGSSLRDVEVDAFLGSETEHKGFADQVLG